MLLGSQGFDPLSCCLLEPSVQITGAHWQFKFYPLSLASTCFSILVFSFLYCRCPHFFIVLYRCSIFIVVYFCSESFSLCGHFQLVSFPYCNVHCLSHNFSLLFSFVLFFSRFCFASLSFLTFLKFLHVCVMVTLTSCRLFSRRVVFRLVVSRL